MIQQKQDEERLRRLSRLGDPHATWELARADRRRGCLPTELIVEQQGPETFTMFFLRGVQLAVQRLNEPTTFAFPFSGGVVGLQVGGIDMRAAMDRFLRGDLPSSMAWLMRKRPDPGLRSFGGECWRASPMRAVHDDRLSLS